MNCELLILALLLVTMILLINYNYHYLLVLSTGIMVILVLNGILKKESFQVNMDTILSSNRNPIEVEQQKQELMISNLEDKLKFYKAALKEDLNDTNENSITKIKIENSCGPFDQTDDMSDFIPDTDDMTINNTFFVNRGQIPEI
jgi:hypothetical protein